MRFHHFGRILKSGFKFRPPLLRAPAQFHLDPEHRPGREHALLGDGDEVDLDAGAEGARVLLLAARPLGEPIAWWGPIVMNTEDELRAAVEEYHEGTFVGRRR